MGGDGPAGVAWIVASWRLATQFRPVLNLVCFVDCLAVYVAGWVGNGVGN